MSGEERFWSNRLRWRLRGALQWPAFVLFTLLDAVVINALPPAVIERPNLIVGVLAATFGNLVLVGVAAPFLAKRLAAREPLAHAGATAVPPETRREVLQDRVAAVLLAAGLLATLVSGLANRPVIVSETEATEEVGRQLRAYVDHSGDEELRRNLETANTVRLERGLLPRLHRPRRPPSLRVPADRHREGADRGAPRPQRGAQRQLRPLGAAEQPQPAAARSPRTPRCWLRPTRSAASGTFTAKLSARPGRKSVRLRVRWKLRPTASIRPLTATARSRSAPRRPPVS